MSADVRPFVRHYDSIYGDKDYARDVAVVSRVAGLTTIAAPRVLEIGPGTGNHTVLLARQAARVVSVEVDPDFVVALRAKVERLGLTNVEVEQETLDRLDGQSFDAACALFHVLNYVGRSEMPGFARSLAARLVPGAWFVADLWNLDAVELDPPRHEIRRKALPAATLTQAIEPTFDRDSGQVRLDYRIVIEPSEPAVDFRESLHLQLWSADDLRAIFAAAGFGALAFYDHADPTRAPDSRSFRQWLCARKLEASP